MNKKYISIILIISILTATIFTGCANNEEDDMISTEAAHTFILQEFNKLSEVPRNTGGDMSKITEYIKDRLKLMGLNATQDKVGNLMVEKPATAGYENAPTTIIQTNMDMVSVAGPSIIFNSETDGITPLVNEEEKRITGNNTSLGAASGIGMASIFFILENSSEHGPIKAVFTVDGEGDMNGAKNIDPTFIEGDNFINLTNNKSNKIETGSAWSSVIMANENVEMIETKNRYSFVLVADGFVGGDSGTGSQKNQGNPVKFLVEVLAMAKGTGLMFELCDISGGDNVYDIPQTATATITVNDYEKSKISSIFNNAAKEYLEEHIKSDPDAKLDIIETTVPDNCLNDEDTANLISFLYGLSDEEYSEKYSTASSNIGTVNFGTNKVDIGIFIQSKDEESIMKITDEHQVIAEISNISMKSDDAITGFSTPESDDLPKRIADIYKNTIGASADNVYRATRTELGYFQEKNPNLQMVSIGPTVANECKITEYVILNTIETPAMAVMSYLLESK